METKTQKKTLLSEIGSLSDGTISLAATLAMGVLLNSLSGDIDQPFNAL